MSGANLSTSSLAGSLRSMRGKRVLSLIFPLAFSRSTVATISSLLSESRGCTAGPLCADETGRKPKQQTTSHIIPIPRHGSFSRDSKAKVDDTQRPWLARAYKTRGLSNPKFARRQFYNARQDLALRWTDDEQRGRNLRPQIPRFHGFADGRFICGGRA